jgi:hypothetical protein
MFGWGKKDNPLSTKQMLANTDPQRILRAQTQVRIESYTQDFIIKKLGLIDKIKNFFSKNKVNTLFVKFNVNTHNIKNGNKHLVILVVPYYKNMSTRVLSDVPIQVYSDTADFKFRFAYELFTRGNCYTDEVVTKKLGVALSIKPTKVRPLNSPQFDKHIYSVISQIDKLKVTY